MILAERAAVYSAYPVNFYEVVPHLLNLYPTWSEEDLLSFFEEKTGRRVHPEDQITLRAVYRRHLRSEWTSSDFLDSSSLPVSWSQTQKG